jgi:hypothetical protein
MKLRIISDEVSKPVVRRFPHLESTLHAMVLNDENFSQLCGDYKDVVNTLNLSNSYKGDTRSDLIALKTTLEVEILEQVSRRDEIKKS